MRVVVAGAAVVATVAGCGQADEATVAPTMLNARTATSSVAAPVSTTAPTAPAPTTHPDELVLRPVRADLGELPISEPIDHGCGLVTLSYIVRKPLVFDGSVGHVGALGEYTAGPEFDTIVGRVVQFEVTDVAVDSEASVSADGMVSVLWPEQYIFDERRWFAAGPELDRVGHLSSALVFADVIGDLKVPVVSTVASQADAGLSFNGACQHLESVADGVASAQGEASAVDLLRRNAVAAAAGDDLAGLDAAATAYYKEADKLSRPRWGELDPATRILAPATVPDDLRDALDVVGMSFAVSDLDGSEAIGVRTESGVSEPLVGSTALPSVAPLYFLAGIDETVEVFVTAGGPVADYVPVASVPLSDLDGAWGFEVSGSVSDGGLTFSTLTKAELATRLHFDESVLDSLRDQYLEPPPD